MRVCHVGNMANDGYAAVSALREAGVDAELIIDANDFGMGLPQWETSDVKADPYKQIKVEDLPPPPDWVHVWRHEDKGIWVRLMELHRMIRGYDLLHLHFPASVWLMDTPTPYLVYEAGFIRQMGDGRNWTRMGAEAYHRARCVTWTNTDTRRMVEAVHPQRMEFVPFAIDTERYRPGQRDATPWWFMPSRQVWDVKGNDLFLRAYLKYVKNGGSTRLTLVDWGYEEDVLAAKDLLRPVSDQVTWIPPQPKPRLIELYQRSSAVFDQFLLGASGTAGFEAMSCGTPLCMFFSESAAACFGEAPPCLNAASEPGIGAAMWRLEDEGYRRRLGERERIFVEKHLSYPVVAKQLRGLYEEV